MERFKTWFKAKYEEGKELAKEGERFDLELTDVDGVLQVKVVDARKILLRNSDGDMVEATTEGKFNVQFRSGPSVGCVPTKKGYEA